MGAHHGHPLGQDRPSASDALPGRRSPACGGRFDRPQILRGGQQIETRSRVSGPRSRRHPGCDMRNANRARAARFGRQERARDRPGSSRGEKRAVDEFDRGHPCGATARGNGIASIKRARATAATRDAASTSRRHALIAEPPW